MAKETCAFCGKLVGALYRQQLGDGSIICLDCWNLGKFGIGVKSKQLTLDTFRRHLATDQKSLAAQQKAADRQDRRELNEAAAQIKQERKSNAALDKLGLNLDQYGQDELRDLNRSGAQQIAATLTGSKFYSAGALLGGNPAELFQTELSRVQIQQNSILIRQNEEIIRLLQRLADDK